MNMLHSERHHSLGANWLNVFFGLGLIISPFLLEFEQWEVAMWNDIAVGVMVMYLSLFWNSSSKIATNLTTVLGIWLVLSPFALDFTAPPPFWTSFILGVLIALSALLASAKHPSTDGSRH